MTNFLLDFTEFSKGRFFAEAAVRALEAVEDDASESEAIDAGMEWVNEQLADQEEAVVGEAHTHITNFRNLVDDLQIIDDLAFEDLILDGSPDMDNGGIDEDPDGVVDELVTWDETTVEYTLLDGRTLEFDSNYIVYGLGDSMDQGQRASSLFLKGDGREDFVTVEGGDQSHEDLVVEHSLHVDDWPADEYDELDDETQDEIEEPDEDAATARPAAIELTKFQLALENLHEFQNEVEGEVETWLTDNYDDLVEGDLDPEDVMTPEMLAAMSSEQQTFPYAGASLEVLGMPSSAQTVRLRFPETTDDDGEPVESSGNLYAHPMPSGGFSTGQTIDPGSVESTFWYAFHVVDDDGMQSSELSEIEEPFEIVRAEEVVQDEDGEWVVEERDEVDWSESVTNEPPADYEELTAMLDQLDELERQIAAEEREIVVELDGQSPGGGGGSIDWSRFSIGGIPGGAVAVGGVVGGAGVLSWFANRAAQQHPARQR
ncbi:MULTISPECIES: hypothetical protein [Bacteria]|uniref:hypothetical protein n=1 Tax=Bacteria TaxID=2 RepID=UPI0018A6E7B8|nr:hypothetical protein [Halomonas sp. 328]MBF8224505.1 hypothetical protein [Halomonas sp. 328]